MRRMYSIISKSLIRIIRSSFLKIRNNAISDELNSVPTYGRERTFKKTQRTYFHKWEPGLSNIIP